MMKCSSLLIKCMGNCVIEHKGITIQKYFERVVITAQLLGKECVVLTLKA